MTFLIDRRRAWVGVLAGGFALAACGSSGAESGGSSEWAGSVRDSAGVQIVDNPATGLWGSGDEWTVSEALRIGTSAGDADYQFGQISGIAELSDGRIAVFDAQAQHLRMFSADGTYERTIGRPGSGPGEFALAAGPVLVAPGDTLVVPDVTNQRVNRFDEMGEPLGSFRMDFASGIPMAWLDRPDGAIVSQMRPLALPGGEDLPETPNDVLVRRRSDGTVVDTLLRIESGETITITDGGAEIRFFSPEPIWALSRDGVMFGVNDDYRFFVYAGDGSLERVITKPFTPREVPDADKQLLLGAMIRLYEEFGVRGPALEMLRNNISFGDTYPAYALLRGGPGGSIWVQHLRTPADMSEEELEAFNPQLGFGSPNWDVFDTDGRFLGVVRMPDRFQPIRFGDDRIYGIWRDELDVQHAMILEVDGI